MRQVFFLLFCVYHFENEIGHMVSFFADLFSLKRTGLLINFGKLFISFIFSIFLRKTEAK